MPKKYPPLLPAVGPHSEQSSPSSSLDLGKRKRVGTQIACNPCRRKKIRCDGKLPVCGFCRKRETECVYAEKRETIQQSYEILELLRSMPEPRALETLGFLRERGSSASILSIVKGGMDGKHLLSEHNTALRLSSPAPSAFEFELMIRNPISYPPLHSTFQSAAGERSLLLQAISIPHTEAPGPQYACAYVFGHSSSQITEPRLISATGKRQSFRPPRLNDRSRSSDARECNAELDSVINASRVGDFQGDSPAPAYYCDSRLQALEIGFWTNISVNNDFAARVISLYLETDHPLLGIFDPDLFITDLVGKRLRFCSRLLVSSLLYWGCQMYSAIDKAAGTLAHAFCDEAEELWLTERKSDSLLAMASAQLLSLSFLGQGKDQHLQKYLAEASQMGIRMGLFGADEANAKKFSENRAKEVRRASSFAAWGVFNWIVLTSLFYQQPGLEYPNSPPSLPIPGDTDKEDASDKTWTDNSVEAEAQLPHYMGVTFTALCKFWRIIYGVTSLYYKNQHSHLRDYVTLEFAEYKYRELIAWAENLDPALMQGDRCPHHVVIFHMWFHAAILDIFRPFLQQRQTVCLRLKTFSANHSSPDAAYKASVNQLKRLVVIYRCNYNQSAYTILWHTALTYVANAVLHDKQGPESILYFLLCIYCYESLRRCYRVSEAIGRSLLSMMMRSGYMSAVDARELLQNIREKGIYLVPGDIRATFMADLHLAMTDPDAARVENLAKEFEDIALFHEFVDLGKDETESL